MNAEKKINDLKCRWYKDQLMAEIEQHIHTFITVNQHMYYMVITTADIYRYCCICVLTDKSISEKGSVKTQNLFYIMLSNSTQLKTLQLCAL